jgi:hypothetical protein
VQQVQGVKDDWNVHKHVVVRFIHQLLVLFGFTDGFFRVLLVVVSEIQQIIPIGGLPTTVDTFPSLFRFLSAIGVARFGACVV